MNTPEGRRPHDPIRAVSDRVENLEKKRIPSRLSQTAQTPDQPHKARVIGQGLPVRSRRDAGIPPSEIWERYYSTPDKTITQEVHEPESQPLEPIPSVTEPHKSDPFQKLTPTQRGIALLMIKGHTIIQIAHEQDRNPENVRIHRGNMARRLGIETKDLLAELQKLANQG